jgi:hypothetical protein
MIYIASKLNNQDAIWEETGMTKIVPRNDAYFITNQQFRLRRKKS